MSQMDSSTVRNSLVYPRLFPRKSYLTTKVSILSAGIAENEIQSELNDNKFFILEKCDKFGRPIFLEISNRHFRKTCDLAQNKRMIVYGMDLCLRLAEAAGGDGKVTSVFDMRGKPGASNLIQTNPRQTGYYPFPVD
jgi:hypothetical protein